MGQVARHNKVKLIVGFIFNDEKALKKAEALISEKFGPVDLESRVIDFSHTDYYNDEFGTNLKRKLISLKRLVSPEDIYRTKLITNKMEHSLSRSNKRTVNIDPGYITEGKLVLLTTKDHSHRIYLRNGIYAESTLKFHRNTFLPWQTTFPDYKTDTYIKIFKEIRNQYKKDIRI